MKQKTIAIALILFTTLFTSSAQISLKYGINTLGQDFSGIMTNYHLILGLLFYAIAGSLAIIAFRKGEVSVLYPLFGTSYIWVSLLSIYFFREVINPLKWGGIIVIIIGVTFLGFGSATAGRAE